VTGAFGFPYEAECASWAALGKRIDLIDEHLALDDQGTGRGFVTFCLTFDQCELLETEEVGR
jgi:hypothetical protein